MSRATPSETPDSSIPADLRLDGSAAAAGFRLPAEWEPLEAVWLARPRDEMAFPGCLAAAQTEWDNLATRLRETVEVRETASLGIPTSDSRIRDFGPIFLVHPQRGVAAQAFRSCRPETDPLGASLPAAIARRCRIPMWPQDRVLEGGSVATDGLGTLLVAERSVAKPPGEAVRARDGFESMLRDTLGVSTIVRLPGWDEDAGGSRQLDDLARFVAPGIVAAVEAPPGHPDHAILASNRDALRLAADSRGRRIEVVPLPSPAPIHHEFPADRSGPRGRRTLPASHASFLVANGRLFVPVFGSRSDDLACRRLEEASGLRAVAVMARHLVVGLGGLHRLACPQPAAARTGRAVVWGSGVDSGDNRSR